MEPIQVTFSVGALLPQILLTAGGLLLLGVSLLPRAQRLELPLSLATLLATAWVYASRWSETRELLGGMMVVDRFATGCSLLLLLVGVLSCLISGGYLGHRYQRTAEYYSLILFCVLGMTVMAQSQNFVALFLGLEIFSVCLYLLCAFAWKRKRSLESSLKYFLLGAFSSGFILYGMALIYGATNSLDIKVIGTLLQQRQADIPLTLLAGLGLLVVGLVFKIGIVPFHFWIPDVYEGAPTSVTAFMAAGTKVAAFAALLRVLHVGFGEIDFTMRWAPLLGILAALTMTMANVVALSQSHIKRLLAYSSVAHAGYLLLAVATNTIEGVESLAFYLLAYVFANLGAFAVAVAVGRGGEETEEEGYQLSDYAGLGKSRPGLAAAMTVFMLSLTGIPPTAGFLGKWFIFRSALDADMLGLALVLAVNSAIAAYYYLGVIVQMYMVEPDTSPAPAPVRMTLSLSTGLAVVAVFYLGIFPGRVLTFLTEMAQHFWGQIHLV
jgi:NADH-quinone oxidoreductase subunit N